MCYWDKSARCSGLQVQRDVLRHAHGRQSPVGRAQWLGLRAVEHDKGVAAVPQQLHSAQLRAILPGNEGDGAGYHGGLWGAREGDLRDCLPLREGAHLSLGDTAALCRQDLAPGEQHGLLVDAHVTAAAQGGVLHLHTGRGAQGGQLGAGAAAGEGGRRAAAGKGGLLAHANVQLHALAWLRSSGVATAGIGPSTRPALHIFSVC